MGAQQSKLSADELTELQQNTLFDKKELQQWYKGFCRDCPQGHLDRQAFHAVYKQFFPFGDASAFSSLIFTLFDKDGDQLVSFKEFIVALSITSRAPMPERIKWAFELYDRDRDGFVTPEELYVVVNALYKMTGSIVKMPADEDTPQKRVDKLMSKMDLDGDGKLSLIEFQKGVMTDPSLLQSLSIYDGLL